MAVDVDDAIDVGLAPHGAGGASLGRLEVLLRREALLVEQAIELELGDEDGRDVGAADRRSRRHGQVLLGHACEGFASGIHGLERVARRRIVALDHQPLFEGLGGLLELAAREVRAPEPGVKLGGLERFRQVFVVVERVLDLVEPIVALEQQVHADRRDAHGELLGIALRIVVGFVERLHGLVAFAEAGEGDGSPGFRRAVLGLERQRAFVLGDRVRVLALLEELIALLGVDHGLIGRTRRRQRLGRAAGEVERREGEEDAAQPPPPFVLLDSWLDLHDVGLPEGVQRVSARSAAVEGLSRGRS